MVARALRRAIEEGHPRRARALLRLRGIHGAPVALCLFWEGALTKAAAMLASVPRTDATNELRALALVLDGHLDDARALGPQGLASAFLELLDGDLDAAERSFACFVDGTAMGRLARFGLAATAHRKNDRVGVELHLRSILAAEGDLFVTRWARAQWDGPLPRRRPRSAARVVVGLVLLVFLVAGAAGHRTAIVHDSAPGPTMAAAIAQVAPQREGMTDLYFLSVAGYGAQDVFHNEALAAERVMVERFDTQDRTLVLTNDPRGEGFYPRATKAMLEQGLAGLGARMNTAEDVLFLFLTSHGSSKGLVLRSSFAAYDDDDDDDDDDGNLRPEELRSMLDAASIRWRVLVIAGCETGVFVGPLANDSTLVVTAAASDRNSYGCGNGRANTEFGRAIFTEQLAKQSSFSAAFGAAIREIGFEEANAGLLPSRPQLAEGAAIGRRLRAFEQRLDANPTHWWR